MARYLSSSGGLVKTFLYEIIMGQETKCTCLALQKHCREFFLRKHGRLGSWMSKRTANVDKEGVTSLVMSRSESEVALGMQSLAS